MFRTDVEYRADFCFLSGNTGFSDEELTRYEEDKFICVAYRRGEDCFMHEADIDFDKAMRWLEDCTERDQSWRYLVIEVDEHFSSDETFDWFCELNEFKDASYVQTYVSAQDRMQRAWAKECEERDYQMQGQMWIDDIDDRYLRVTGRIEEEWVHKLNAIEGMCGR